VPKSEANMGFYDWWEGAIAGVGCSSPSREGMGRQWDGGRSGFQIQLD
jgi:hypothetical protein